MNTNINKYEIIKYTVLETYPDYMIKELLTELENKKIIRLKKIKEEENNELQKVELDLSKLSSSKAKEKLKFFLDTLKPGMIKGFDFIKFVENFEWEKMFRYSVLLKTKGLDENKIENLIEENKVEKYDDALISTNTELWYENFQHPVLRSYENKYIIKFPLIRTGLNNDKKAYIKYPVLIIIDSSNDLLEIRFDSVKPMFQGVNTKMFYENLINSAVAWVKTFLKISLEQLDLKEPVQNIIENYTSDMKNANIIPIRRDCSLKDGSKVVLDIDANKEFLVPIISDLKELENNYTSLYNNLSPIEENKKFENDLLKIKCQIEDILLGVELADVPKISLRWRKEGILLGITHAYKETEYSLLYYYAETKSSELMDYVRKYFGENRNNCKE